MLENKHGMIRFLVCGGEVERKNIEKSDVPSKRNVVCKIISRRRDSFLPYIDSIQWNDMMKVL
jgi:hypothetical protein